MGRSLALATVTALAALGLAACGSTRTSNPTQSSSGGAVSSVTIVIKNFAFHPASVTVTPGATITVMNEDNGTTHTLTAVAPHQGAFDTGNLAGPATKKITAPTAPGTYPYICEIHQYMTGTITVS